MTLAQLAILEALIEKVGISEVRTNSRVLAHLETSDRDFFASAVSNEAGVALAALWNSAPVLLATMREKLSPPDVDNAARARATS